jgi:hypothetical protein
MGVFRKVQWWALPNYRNRKGKVVFETTSLAQFGL